MLFFGDISGLECPNISCKSDRIYQYGMNLAGDKQCRCSDCGTEFWYRPARIDVISWGDEEEEE